MMLVPPEDRVLIRQCEPETETAFGLAIPENAQERPLRGIVVAVGAGARDRNGVQHPPGVQVGDEVVLPRFGGTSLEYDGDELISVLASELLGVVAA